MKNIFTILAVFCLIFLSSCEKEQKKYDGDAQIAFSLAKYSFNVTSTTGTITIPIQLISTGAMDAVTANIAVESQMPANIATVPVSAVIEGGKFTANLVVKVNYAALDSKSNKLVLNLTSNIKVAENFKQATITLVKK
ncbi:MAG: hypothetical protein RSC28_02980 [Bacteroidales bacterium]